MTAPRPLQYRIDAENRIVELGSAWSEFASGNGAADLFPASVLGKALWDFVEGADVKQLYEVLLECVRSRGVSVAVPFRCDSGDRRRFMELVLTPRDSEEVLLESRTLREEERAAVRLLDSTSVRSEELVTMCSWCKRVLLDDGSWAEVEQAVEELALFDAEELPRITHGVCEACKERVLSEASG